MISTTHFEPYLVDVSGQPKPVVGLPDGVIKYRCRFRPNSIPVIFLRFEDRVQKHVLLSNGPNLEPFECPEGVNVANAPAEARRSRSLQPDVGTLKGE
jgi:hypothetical protein